MAAVYVNGAWVDSQTGAPSSAPPSASNSKANPFNPDYLAKHPTQANPFQQGTSQYNDFQNSQIKQMTDNAGQPALPSFNSRLDPQTGLLKGNLTYSSPQINTDALNGINLNTAPLQALEAQGMRSGPSAWANLMNQSVQQNKTNALDQVAGQAQGANAQALSSLAMRGGLDSGARTSLAKNMQQNINANSQAISRGANSDLANVGIQDESNRLGILSALPGQEIASLQPDITKAQMNLGAQQANQAANNAASQFNINQASNEALQQRGFDVNQYNQLMQAWGAGKTADATSSGGKK